VEELYLDPGCDFVATKSAESDGMSFDVAYRHYCDCEQCRQHHAMYIRRHKLIEKKAAEKERELRTQDQLKEQLDEQRRKLNDARLQLVIAHLNAVSVPLFNLQEIEHSPGLMGSVVSELRISGVLEFRIRVRSDDPTAYFLHFSGWSADHRYSSTTEVLNEIAEELARTRYKARAEKKEKKNGRVNAERSS
jgi:hypothetical protein